jgi:hypothetical protein
MTLLKNLHVLTDERPSKLKKFHIKAEPRNLEMRKQRHGAVYHTFITLKILLFYI